MNLFVLYFVLLISNSVFAASNVFVCDNGSAINIEMSANGSGVHRQFYINGQKLSHYNGELKQYWYDTFGSLYIFELRAPILKVYQADSSGNVYSTWTCRKTAVN